MKPNFPKHITFLSDSSQVKFVEEIVSKDKTVLGKYIFSKVHKKSPNKGKELTMTLDQIEGLKNDKLIEVK
jgi:hypothetical protein